MAVDFKDYYEILGVPRNASAEEIRRAFRKLAREYHPDVARDKRQAEEKFKEINEAHEVLSDPDKRRQYDELGMTWGRGAEFRPPPGWQQQARRTRFGRADGPTFEFRFSGTGFSDFFEQFFGSMAGARGRSGEHASWREDFAGSSRGRDTEADLMVTLEEVARGAVRPVTVQRSTTCNECEGTGRSRRQLCPVCGGAGRIVKTERYQVKIPPGVREGQRLRLAGRGEEGTANGRAGDLYLRVRLAKHPDFRFENDRLYHDLNLAPWEAVLGATVSVPTLAGHVQIRIPPGTQTGHQLRLRERGLPRHGARPDDLYVVVHVQVPERLGPAERALWEKLAQDSTFRPRD
jgi:curved DNA-binding protein